MIGNISLFLVTIILILLSINMSTIIFRRNLASALENCDRSSSCTSISINGQNIVSSVNSLIVQTNGTENSCTDFSICNNSGANNASIINGVNSNVHQTFGELNECTGADCKNSPVNFDFFPFSKSNNFAVIANDTGSSITQTSELQNNCNFENSFAGSCINTASNAASINNSVNGQVVQQAHQNNQCDDGTLCSNTVGENLLLLTRAKIVR